MEIKMTKLQRYKIEILRSAENRWVVTGYWEMDDPTHPYGHKSWSLDGAPRYFASRKEAIEFVANQKGIPE